jgi:mxaJ protein
MSLVSRALIVVAALGSSHVILAARAGRPAEGRSARTALRVCADPNNLPFSNERGQGFENKIAALAARDMRRPLTYVWMPQRRGFIRNTLRANRCDVVVGVPTQLDALRTTHSYYRSVYMFVSRRDRQLHVRSFDDPRLTKLRIGIQITGDDYANPPAAQALASRRIIDNVRGYTVYGDYSRPNPPRGLIDAVADGRVDVAVAWGPLAGYFAQREAVPLELVPVSQADETPLVRFAFDISMGVRREDAALAEALNAIIARRQHEIRRILLSYGVPLVART